MEHDGAGQLSGPTARPVQRIEGIEVVGDVLYAAHQDAGLSWFDANTMATLGNDPQPDNAIDVASAEDMLWVADRQRGLLGYRLEDGQPPSLEVELLLEGSAQAMDALPGVVAIAAGGRVHLVDTSSTASPRLASTIEIEGIATRVALKDTRTLAVAAWNDTRLYDITTLDTPALIALEDATSSAMSVTWAGEVLVVGDWDDLRTYSVDLDAQAPEWTGPSRLTVNGDAGTAVSAAFLVENEGSLDLQLEEASCSGAELAIEPSRLLIEPGVTAVLELVGTFGSTSPEEARCTFITNDPDEPSVEVEVVLNELGLSVGDAAPDFSVPNLEGTDVYTLQDARGEILLLTIFSSL